MPTMQGVIAQEAEIGLADLMRRGRRRAGDFMRHVSIHGRRFAVDDEKPTFWDRAERGQWEPELLDELSAHLRPGVTFLDIGGWVGPTSLFAAACGADVIALEPDPAAARQFRANCAANPAFADRIRLIEAALTADGAPGLFGSPRKPGDSMGSLLLAGRGTSDWEASGIAPEALLAMVPAKEALVIKIDIEGGEYRLGSALQALASLKPQIVLIGFHPALMLLDEKDGRQALEQATQAIFSAFEGMKPSILGQVEGSPLTEALLKPITVRFSRV